MKIIALDLDGTLLTYDKRLTEKTKDVLMAASEQGHWIVPATGRALKAIPEAVLSLPFLRYVISINGASVSDQLTGEKLYSANIPTKIALELMEYAKQFDCMYDCYWQDTGWSNRTFLDRIWHYHTDEEVVRLILNSRQPVDDLEQMISKQAESVQKVQLCFRDLEERKAAKHGIEAHFPEIVATSSFQNNLELNWITADKGKGLLHLAGHLGLDASDTIAFGDSSNDLSMLRAAGTGVAMGNASEEVKSVCDAVTLTNDQDGVASYLEQHLLR